MGASGVSPFEDDCGMDFLSDFLSNPSLQLLESTFDLIIENQNDYIDANEAGEALMACEIIAAIKGNASKELIEYQDENRIKLQNIIIQSITDTIIQKGISAVKIILNSSNSELKELWEDSDYYDEWIAESEDLILRINL